MANPEVPAEFYAIGKNLREQNNRYTADPMFIVFQKQEIVTHEDYDHDYVVWVNDDGEEADERKARRLQALDDGCRDTGEWKRLAVKEIDQFVTACFTLKGCEDYLAINRHNLRKPYIYVEGSYRNHEYQSVRNWLMSLPEGGNHA